VKTRDVYVTKWGRTSAQRYIQRIWQRAGGPSVPFTVYVCEYVERSKTSWTAYMYGSLCECVFMQKVSVLKLPLNRGLDLSTTRAQEIGYTVRL